MAQVKIYGLRDWLEPIRPALSDAVHDCVVEALSYPPDKKFHRFFPLDEADFIFPSDRSRLYTILEISLFEGRSVKAKKKLIRLLYERLEALGLPRQDLEITLLETPRHNWGIRGLPGDELPLSYTVEV